MKLLNLTLNDPAANVALDEALLEDAESGNCNDEILRLWQPKKPIVVAGRSSPIAREVNTAYCESQRIPVIRRCSGGSTILTADGCLMYAVLLDYRLRPELRPIDNAHRFVMGKIREAVRSCGIEVEYQGISDLTIDNKKISGNALRCKRNWFIYHGTLIGENMNLQLISECLGKPQREPDYRRGRTHAQFLTQIPLETKTLAGSLTETWDCRENLKQWPEKRTESLVQEKYDTDEWNLKI